MGEKDTDEKVVDLGEARLRAHDHIVRGTAADGQLRAFAMSGRETVQEMRDRHHTSNVVTAALGRLMMAGQMMGAMSKVDDELITLEVRGDGPVGGLTVTANNRGQAKGFAYHPNVWLPLRADSHLDVGGAVGSGTLTVIHDIAGMEPYSSTIELASGEIGDDLTYYFAESEQIPTSLGVGVLVDVDYSVRQAGGFVIQAMPPCSTSWSKTLRACAPSRRCSRMAWAQPICWRTCCVAWAIGSWTRCRRSSTAAATRTVPPAACWRWASARCAT